MSAPSATERTGVLLSFSSAYQDLAQRLADDLKAANIAVRLDQWLGGGGAPAFPSVAGRLDDIAFVVPLLTPSEAAPTWVGAEWTRTIYEQAGARGIEVLPVRGDGDLEAVPELLRERSFADLGGQYDGHELRRLVETIRQRSGDLSIQLPADERDATAERPALTLPADPLRLEVGVALAPLLADGRAVDRFANQMVPMMRDGLFFELGVRFPPPRLRVAADLPPSAARVLLGDVPEMEQAVHPHSVMVSDSAESLAAQGFRAEAAVNPANGNPTAWVPADQAVAAEERGLATWDAHGYLILLLSSVLRRKAGALLGVHETEAMLKQIEPIFPRLVAETVSKRIYPFVLTDVLRRLLVEYVSIRNLRRILMTLVQWGGWEEDPLYLAEYARAALQREITHRLSRGTKQLVVFLLHPALEQKLQSAIRHTQTGSYLDLDADGIRALVAAIGKPLERLPAGVQMPQILTTLEIRAAVRRLIAPTMPWLHVISYQELEPTTSIQPLARIALDGLTLRKASVRGVLI